MIRPATSGDAARLIAFLSVRPGAAMFPLSNLHGGRLRSADQPLEGQTQMHGWLAETGGAVTGFLGLSGGGHLMPFGAPADWAAFRPPLAGRQVAAVIGPDGLAPGLLAALGLDAAPRRHQDDEPGFVLPLADLRLPDAGGCRLAPLAADQRDLATLWRIAYLAEVFGDRDNGPRAARDVAGWIAAGSHRLLWREGRPVALTGFNARIPGTVQVGAVWTPPEARGQGLARRAVGLHLAEARAEGESTAVLFAANAAAAAAYRALGFRPAGRMGIIELAAPAAVPPCPRSAP